MLRDNMSLRVEAGFEHLRAAFAQVLAKEVEFPRGTFVTVLNAKVTANTAHAKFVLSVLPQTMEKEVLATLREYDQEIKRGLTENLRLRRVPRLHYGFDKMTAHADEIDNMIWKLKEKGEIDPEA